MIVGDTETDEAAIRRVRQAHLDAAEAHDIDALVSTWAEDGVELPPNEPPTIGKEAYRARCERVLGEMGDYDSSFETAELEECGDWAFERGTFVVRSRAAPVRGEAEQRGKYIWIYRRQPDGTWKWARAIWNAGF